MDCVEPRSGWDNKPLEEDTGAGADLTRIKYYRNVLAHHKNGKIDETNFKTIRKDLLNVSHYLLDLYPCNLLKFPQKSVR